MKFKRFIKESTQEVVCLECEKEPCEPILTETLSNKEKLKLAYPELNFDESIVEASSCLECEDTQEMIEELSNKEKLLRAFPELNFDTENLTESGDTEYSIMKKQYKNCVKFDDAEKDSAAIRDLLDKLEGSNIPYDQYKHKKGPGLTIFHENFVEELSAREKLKAAYPELNFDTEVVVETTESTNNFKEVEDEIDFDYDDEYEMDDVEQDRAHAALYGGDRMYCDCGRKLAYNEYGSYCPDCDAENLNDFND